jgi:RHS repeat-associated protein
MQYIILVSLYFYSLLNFSLSRFFFDSLKTFGIAFKRHEHIDEMGLIHMNGRVYDPQIGRFLSADPYIQSPYNTQSYNSKKGQRPYISQYLFVYSLYFKG